MSSDTRLCIKRKACKANKRKACKAKKLCNEVNLHNDKTPFI